MTDIRKLFEEAMKTQSTREDDEYLEEIDKHKPEFIKKEKTKRKCDNCTCEMRENNVWDNSTCTNCDKGDAFRCSDCPSRGLPSWKPGDIVRFD